MTPNSDVATINTTLAAQFSPGSVWVDNIDRDFGDAHLRRYSGWASVTTSDSTTHVPWQITMTDSDLPVVKLPLGVNGSTSLPAVSKKANKTARQADDVTRRAPRATDDSSTGYAYRDLWNWPGHGLWICVDATPGAALWQPLPVGILPLDAVPGVELHGYGTRRLSASFGGAAPLQVLFAGSTPADVLQSLIGGMIGHGLEQAMDVAAA